MKLEGTYTFDAPREAVWDALLDPEVLARILPGCEKLDQLGDNQYAGTLKIRVGPVQGKFQGKVVLTDLQEPTSYSLILDGKGAPGFMKGQGQVELDDQEGKTLMHYVGEAQVGGRIASVGQRLLDSSAKALTKQSLDGLNQQIQARLQAKQVTAGSSGAVPAPADIPIAAPEPPSQTDFAFGVAKNMLEDLVPPERRPTLIAAGLGTIALFMFLLWWTNVVARKVANEIWEQR
jgi:carbon monoxide dehydrogenase subunit G